MTEEFVKLRKSLGWNQKEAARQIGVSSDTVNSFECGRRINMGRTLILAIRRLTEHPEERLDSSTN